MWKTNFWRDVYFVWKFFRGSGHRFVFKNNCIKCTEREKGDSCHIAFNQSEI